MDSHVVVLGFEGQFIAEGVLEELNGMQERGLLTVEDAVIASRGSGSNVEVTQTKKLTKKFALRGGGVGLLAGILLGGPIGGLAAGSMVGAMTGSMKDYGIDDKFINQIKDGLRPDSSALFLLVKTSDDQEVRDQIREELAPYKAYVAMSTLPEEQEKRLRETLAEES